ncbi:MAG: 2-phospho-L-lactate transferase CofD family protein, partial [Acidimicrobiia bacterium]
FGIGSVILPATDDMLRTVIVTHDGQELDFREYFVTRRHRDGVARLEFVGADVAKPAPGVMDSISSCDVLVIGPSNPPLSIWPILAIPGVEDAVRSHPRVVAVSPLIGGQPIKGPADRVIQDLGLGTGTDGVASCYRGLIHTLFVDRSDEKDSGQVDDVEVRATDTLIRDPEKARQLASVIIQA